MCEPDIILTIVTNVFKFFLGVQVDQMFQLVVVEAWGFMFAHDFV
jgi:hypothetical protein